MPKKPTQRAPRTESAAPPDAETRPEEAAPKRRATAESMAARQREISVSEFFTKNRHLLGFDNPAKALLTTVKEAVDNSLDACEEAGILPEILVEIREVAGATAESEGETRAPGGGPSRFRVIVEDNGPGIVKPQIPKIFAKLLYGSKFHRLKQSRGQQGIGISAAGLYGQLTTGKPVIITSKTGKGRPAYLIHLRIDTKRNQPDVVREETTEWSAREHGTRVEIELVASYRGGRTGVQEYLEQTAVANPHLGLTFVPPKGDRLEYPRVSAELPREAQEIKPHPHGVELGMLHMMFSDSPGKSVKQVLIDDFSRISPAVAQEICTRAKVNPKTPAEKVHGEDLERLHKALGEVKVLAPPATAVVPIGEILVEGLKRRFRKADLYVSATRPPKVYRGNPFVVEVGLAYGGDLPVDEPAEIMRFANRVPLQYQPKACAISESVYQTNWRGYELPQPKGSLPIGPLALAVHLASVWVPFTSEAKEAVAHYDELLVEMKLALQECGRKLGAHIRARANAERESKRLGLFQRYIPEVAQALSDILGVPKDQAEKTFYDALPSFVRIAEDAGGGGGDGGSDGGSGGGAGPATGGAEAPAAEPRGKGKRRGRGESASAAETPAKSQPAKTRERGAASPPPTPRGGKGKGKGKPGGEQLVLTE
jgi:DNA topoisomerase-6 subunit B